MKDKLEYLVRIRATFIHNGGTPTVCVRCKADASAEGYYETGSGCRIGICRRHKQHGGARIEWYANSVLADNKESEFRNGKDNIQ